MDIRPSPIVGKWYPGNSKRLIHDLDYYLEQAIVIQPEGKIWGVVTPHAGYRYSGSVAAHAFKCLRGLHPDLVVVVSPLHYRHPAPLLTTGHAAYETPLGIIEVDREAVTRLNHQLRQQLGFELTALYNDPEHALEIELPFLQHVLGRFQLLPVMIRDQAISVVEALGRALAQALSGRDVLFVASSDLSHSHQYAQACALDTELLRRLEAFEPQAVMSAQDEGVGYACGRGAIAAILEALRRFGANRVTILHHATSGEISGDYDSVVGYGAAVIWQASEKNRDKKEEQI